MTSRAAIVTTLRDAGATLGSFVAYHRAIGFRHFFLYFDDPADPMLDWARAQPDITAVARNDDLRKIWTGLTLWGEASAHVDHEVMARQLLNAEHAMNLVVGHDRYRPSRRPVPLAGTRRGHGLG